MKLPLSHSALKEIFIHATEAELPDFQGEYIVDMLGLLPSLKRFSHRKVFYKRNEGIYGHNILFNKEWGHFFLEEGVYTDSVKLKTMVINYYMRENTFPVRRIRDYVRCIEKDKFYIGRFHYMIMGIPRFIGYFSLERVR